MRSMPNGAFIGRWLGPLVRIAALAWFVVHFALTVLYVMPENPIRMGMAPVLNATIGTYFYQNWSFFAPNPISSDYALLARPLTEADENAQPAQGLPVDGWYDVSTPLWARFQQNRFSAYDRLTRPLSSAIRAYLTGGPELLPWLESCEKGDKASCVFYEDRLKKTRVEAGKTLSRIGSAVCNDLAHSGARITHVALRVRETLSVPWSERWTSKPVVRDVELGVYAVDRTVAPPGLYVADSLR
jgi:uncharacterized protein DUF5819